MTTSTHKTVIDKELVFSFVRGVYQTEILNLEYIAGGEGSQAFGFETDDQQYVIRVNRHSLQGFTKDEYAFTHFSSKAIPVPEICAIGQMENGYYFAISKKVDGILAKDIDKSEIEKYVAPSFDVLQAIHKTDISTTVGYGKWGSDQKAAYTTWKDFLLQVNMYAVGNEENPSLFGTSFLEEDVWNELHQHFVAVLAHCPEERWLVHGDYGFDNLFVKDGRIAGVIDWEHSMYGDFLYDLAWLSFWSRDFDYKKWYQENNDTTTIAHFNERLLCYQLYIGLGSLSFYAYSNQKDKYESSKKRLFALIRK